MTNLINAFIKYIIRICCSFVILTRSNFIWKNPNKLCYIKETQLTRLLLEPRTFSSQLNFLHTLLQLCFVVDFPTSFDFDYKPVVYRITQRYKHASLQIEMSALCDSV